MDHSPGRGLLPLAAAVPQTIRLARDAPGRPAPPLPALPGPLPPVPLATACFRVCTLGAASRCAARWCGAAS